MTDPLPAPQLAEELRSRAEITELLSLYGYVMDDRDWGALARVFSEDGVFDVSSLGLGVHVGLEGIRSGFETMQHPVAHHVTNVVVELAADGRATATSKWLAPRRDGSMRSGEYRDELARTSEGWRITRRAVSLRRPRPDSL